MASTIVLSSAITLAKYLIKNYALENIQLAILQNSLSMFWMAAPWDWTIGYLDDVNIFAGAEDHTIPNFPANFLSLDTVYLHDGTSIDMPPVPLEIEPFLRSSPLIGPPRKVSHEVVSTVNKYRIRPILSATNTSTVKLIGTYKKQAPVLTLSNIANAGTQVFDDEWFWVFQEIVNYWAYSFSDDQRAERKFQLVTKELIPYMKSIYGLPLDSFKTLPEKRRES